MDADEVMLTVCNALGIHPDSVDRDDDTVALAILRDLCAMKVARIAALTAEVAAWREREGALEGALNKADDWIDQALFTMRETQRGYGELVCAREDIKAALASELRADITAWRERAAALEAALVQIGGVDWPAGHCLDGALEMRRIAGLALRAALPPPPAADAERSE